MTQDAKERAIKSFVEEQEWSYMAEMPRGIGESFGAGWDARGRYDEQRIAALEDALRRYMLYVDSYGYEPHGPLSQAFGPVEHPGSSISTEAWLDRVLREPALRALGQSEVKP